MIDRNPTQPDWALDLDNKKKMEQILGVLEVI